MNRRLTIMSKFVRVAATVRCNCIHRFPTRPRPCNSLSASSGIVGGADAEGTPARPWAFEPAPQPGRPSVCPSTSNSRLGRKSPVAQGRGKMEMTYVGVDVSKDRLDVHVLPEGAAFAVVRDGKGLAELVERMGTLGPERIAVERTGGFGAGGGGQSGAGASLRPGARTAGEDRSDRRPDDRPLRRGDQAGLASTRRRSDPTACRPPPPAPPDP